MSKKKSTAGLEKKILEIIGEYLDKNVKVPALETIRKDPYAQHKLGEILVLLEVTVACIQKQGLDIDKNYPALLTKHELDKTIAVMEEFIQSGNFTEEASDIMKSFSSRKYLFPYLVREFHWVVISILAASYLSAHVIMRSIFELLVGIATKQAGSMSERIGGMEFLSSEEKKDVKKLWKALNGWAHPYNKWTKEICPIFISHEPMYHPELYRQCLEEIEKLVDLLLVIGIEKFEIRSQDISSPVKNHEFDTSNLPFFQKRR